MTIESEPFVLLFAERLAVLSQPPSGAPESLTVVPPQPPDTRITRINAETTDDE